MRSIGLLFPLDIKPLRGSSAHVLTTPATLEQSLLLKSDAQRTALTL